MGMIFPGMDPYLETPRLWSGVHGRMIVYIADALTPRLRPRYVAAIEERVYEGFRAYTVALDEGPEQKFRSDVLMWQTIRAPIEPVHEGYVAILDLHMGQRVVTVIEVLSPTNKYAGPGRESYRAKQREVLAGDVNLVEIDLLRLGPHVLAVPELAARERGTYDYLTCINRAEGLRDAYELYPRRLRERLPRIRIPLADGDPDVALDVQAVLAQTYDAGSYRDRIDYNHPCEPPLNPDDRAWAESLLSGDG